MFNKMIEDGGEILYTRWLWLIDKSRESCRFIAKCLRSRCTDYFSLGLIFSAGNHWPATGHSFLLPWLIKQRNLNLHINRISFCSSPPPMMIIITGLLSKSKLATVHLLHALPLLWSSFVVPCSILYMATCLGWLRYLLLVEQIGHSFISLQIRWL